MAQLFFHFWAQPAGLLRPSTSPYISSKEKPLPIYMGISSYDSRIKRGHVIGPRHVNFHLALDIKRTSSSGATCAAYACSSKGFVKYRGNPVQKRLLFDPVSLYHPFPYAHIFSSRSWCCHNRTAREISPQTKGTSSSLS